ncbi:hypothetical protein GCM10009606_29490 [Nocardioides aquiterrae]|uniref:DoxX family protein n=1 Tax=Nocardioides aquiterrae TaxID=203799 RepID=A0ABN1UHR6_9ACTN
MLQSAWIFVTLNYLYCDVLTLMHRDELQGFLAGEVGGMRISEGFLLGAGALMEIPIGMVLLSRVLRRSAARIANLVAGTVMTVVQAATLGFGPAPFYLFFSAVEITATAFVVVYAWRWREP